MGYFKINQEMVTDSRAKELLKVCPFGAIEYSDGKIEITAGCKMCKLCVKKGPAGVIEYVEEAEKPSVNKEEWNGIAVFVEHHDEGIHPVTFELIGKAKELAKVTKQEVIAVIIGYDLESKSNELLHYGTNKIFAYDNKKLKNFLIQPYTNAFEDFINRVKPSSILIGATNLGRSLAPRTAARFRTGLTADCTYLEMKDNTDLVQIRPAFGGNIMAQIVTPNSRPQFCTVRYKMFSPAPKEEITSGKIVSMDIDNERLHSDTDVVDIVKNAKEMDISEADIIIAVGRGIKTKSDLAIIEELADKINAKIACTRPLVEMGWFDTKRQIGLSGRTVKAKLIITVGISGVVQFAAGMQNSDCIIAINRDKSAPIFDIAHFGIIGNWYEIVPKLINRIDLEAC